jgi:glycosyltransferase involved in cell wall biosynthesis
MLSVGILVDLICGEEAGGQVKCWERFAEEAGSLGDQLDLTLHFLGNGKKNFSMSDNVRFVTHPPVLGTTRFNSMEHIADHTDLAPFHPELLSYLPKYDVIHTTDAFFAMARTANHFSRRNGKPLVTSIHTDVPRYTKLYANQIIGKLCRTRRVRHLMLSKFHLDDVCQTIMKWRCARYLKKCDWVLVSKAEDFDWVGKALPGKGISFLRRGINKEVFHPRKRDRHKLERVLGIPKDRFLLLFVGRVDNGKNVMALAEAARILLDQGEPIHLLIVGDGADSEAVKRLVGPAVTFTGIIPQTRLPWLYASADLFVFPSEIEVHPNVVLEAKSSGLPVMVSAKGGAAQHVKNPGIDGFVLDKSCPHSWARLAKKLRLDSDYRTQVAIEARRGIDIHGPSWREVLVDDLLPVWRRVANGSE